VRIIRPWLHSCGEDGRLEGSKQREFGYNETDLGETVEVMKPEPVPVDAHYSPQFYSELWGISVSTVLRWFQDLDGVLKLNEPSKNGRRTRIELRIPLSLAMRVYREKTRPGLE
jgi:hypothetical protein